MRHLLGVAVLLCVACPTAGRCLQAASPNIVFFLADDLGWGDVGYHGSEIMTPHIDRLAAAGVRLESFYVQPVCSPTRAALMTGRYPCRYGLQVGVIRPWATYGLPLTERILPQLLQEHGYQTNICGKWHLGLHERAYLPTRRGFTTQYGHYCGALDYFTHERDGGFDWHRDDQVCRDEGYTTVLIGNEAVRLVQKHQFDRPFFLYVPFNAPHSPLQALPEDLERYAFIKDTKRRHYAAMVHCMDEQIGRVVAAITERGQLENTLFILSSDNGGPTKLGATNGPLRGAKGTLYEGGTRVVACAAWQGRLPAGRICHEPLHMVDWLPTLLAITGSRAEQPAPLDGRNAWPTLLGKAASPHEDILLNVTPGGGGIRVGSWKLVRNGGQGTGDESARHETGGTNGVELFDLATDPSESRNLAADQPDRVRDLTARLERYAAAAIAPLNGPKPAGFRSPKVWGEAD